ncbi:MAG: hypothetical protein JXB05_12880 [Myxococcaceae bacterium]|nr:hypothetical protein [Myxococcaceae bacterium]
MTMGLHARSLVEHLRHICERPRMYAPDFSLSHLLIFIQGYEVALGDAALPSQHERLREWIYKQRPEWRQSSAWWGSHVLDQCAGDLDRALDAIIKVLDEFLAAEGAEPARSSTRQSQEPS